MTAPAAIDSFCGDPLVSSVPDRRSTTLSLPTKREHRERLSHRRDRVTIAPNSSPPRTHVVRPRRAARPTGSLGGFLPASLGCSALAPRAHWRQPRREGLGENLRCP